MNILTFDQTEFEEVIDSASEAGVDVDAQIKLSFDSLLFLGNAVKGSDDDLLDVAIFNIRLCYVYYKRQEEYTKLSKIASLVKEIEENIQGTKVEQNVLDSININLN